MNDGPDRQSATHSSPGPRLDLGWLPVVPDWMDRLKALRALDATPAEVWSTVVGLAQARLDFIRTDRLAAVLKAKLPEPPAGLATRPVRLAVLGSSTISHLMPGIRIGAARRGVWVDVHLGDYAQYRQELADPGSALYAFKPDVVLFAFDAAHIAAGADSGLDAAGAAAAVSAAMDQVRWCWSMAQSGLGATVLQQTVLPLPLANLGSNEHRLPGGPAAMVAAVNRQIAEAADKVGVHLLDAAGWAARDGTDTWTNPVHWLRGKQEISPRAAPFYGDLVGRLLAALRGRSAKALVLDLDNTLWGGVIGDDGLEGIVLGQGSGLGEAHLAVQALALSLARRGVILAVCSKNDMANALLPFEKHPEMLLRREHIASFVANWDDKATNLRRIAAELNIGIDSLVLLDDNPFERNLIRRELPEVGVPEIGDDAALYPTILTDAGYFESLGVTAEDRVRTALYRDNAARSALAATATDLPSYLRSLEMRLICRPFDRVGLARIAQLINKSNQFNLTTKRYTEDEVAALIDAPDGFGLQLRLLDRFGDNGMIAVVIGRDGPDATVEIDTWLMSCRVLGRQVEEVTLDLVMRSAAARGATAVIGRYLPSAKNAMVANHYDKLGFTLTATAADGAKTYVLRIEDYHAPDIFMTVEQGVGG